METTFYIQLHVKTPGDMQTFGKFYIGDDREVAYKLFERLKGSTDVNGKEVLFAELMETERGLPVNIKMLACTLNELSENCRIITKEIFKLAALAED